MPLIIERGQGLASAELLSQWQTLRAQVGQPDSPADPRWYNAVCEGLRHPRYLLSARRDGQLVGVLPLALVRSLLFGRFLVSLPYVNAAGVTCGSAEAAGALIDDAVALAQSLDVDYLELRHETEVPHPALTYRLASKVLMRRALPATAGQLWDELDSKVRNQIRKGERGAFEVRWGGPELLSDFHGIFSRKMRDLGTPAYGQRLFRSSLSAFGGDAELCVVRDGRRAIAAAFIVHGPGVTSVESAGALREYNSANANMLLYWHLLQRAVERRSGAFCFGRSTIDSNTYRFKKQWGARPQPAAWQYHVRRGNVTRMRRESGSYDRLVQIWRRLPLCLTRALGPLIVRGIP